MKWPESIRKIFGKSRPAPDPDPVSRPDPEEKYRDPVFQDLTDRCAMGDIVAMLELARWHRQFADPEGAQLLAAYEQDPEKWKKLEDWFQKQRYGRKDFHIRCYITWVCRAAIYGNDEAEALAECCPQFRDWSLLPQSLYGLGPASRYRSNQHFYSYDLHRLGLTGIKENLDEFSIYPLKEGIYAAYFLADYIPADSDGFGREDYYEDLFYDEFFNCLPDDKIAQARLSAECMAQKRRDYWEDPAHDREHRMYKRLLSENA